MMRMILLALICLVAGCAGIAKVETGERALGERMSVNIEGPWNRLNTPNAGPAQTWTMEGLAVDRLLLYTGLKDGEPIHARGQGGPNAKVFAFKSTMQPAEIVELFEGMLTRDGSRFRMTRLEPATFGGLKGFRFEYALTRKLDNVQLSGLGYGAISKNEMFAIVYMAPRLTFFARHKDRVESIARSARIKE